MSAAAASTTPAAPPQPSNWLTEWRSRTPLVVRFSIMVVLPVTIISLIFSLSSFTGLIPFRATARFEVWRLITSLFDQGGIFTLLFVLLMLGTQMPAQEIRAGSVAFLTKLVFTGLLINVAFTAVSMMLYLIGGNDPSSFFKYFAIMPSQGLWPVLMASITTNALADPTGSSNFLCLTIPNRLYPWFLVLVFSFISMFPLLDLFTGVIIGHLQHFKILDFLNLSARTISRIETGTGWAVRLGMTGKEGFVYGPETVLPPGARALDREAAEAQWAAFDPIARQRVQQQQQQQQQQQSGGYGDEESGGSSGSRFHTIPARGRSTAASSAGASSSTQTNVSTNNGAFAGEGHSLGGGGGGGGGGSFSSTRPDAEQDGGFSSAPSSVSSIIGNLFGRGGGGGGYSAVDTTGVLGSPDHSGGGGGGSSDQTGRSGVSIEDRRRAAAAAAEARIRALDNRGINSDSPRASQSTTSSSSSSNFAQPQGQGLQQPKREIDRVPLMEGRTGLGTNNGSATTRSTKTPSNVKGGGDDDEFNGEDVDLLYAPVVNHTVTTTTTRPASLIQPKPTANSTPSFVSSSDVQSLVEMGFNKEEATGALTRSKGDMGRALEMLTEDS